jgi:tetratricopeptide (TPR) repeat protein
MLDTTADSLKRVLGKNAKSLAGKQAILDIVYRQWKMAFDPQDDVIESVLPHSALRSGKGNCMGVSLMILILAERLNCPIYGVVLPGHFFCRYDDGASKINIEPNRNGFSHSDDYYRMKYLSQNESWYSLEKLSKTGTIGVFYYTIGTLFLRRNDPEFAAVLLQESCRRFSSLIEAKGNYALALAQCGKSDLAMNLFKELFKTNPTLVNLAANYGAVAMTVGRYELAFQIYKKGLVFFPDDPKLLSGLSQAFAALHPKGFRNLDVK